MFNPEGVKGKTAQPPHNFFKIMAKFPQYIVSVSIKDANTRIELRKTEHRIIGRGLGSYGAEQKAVEQAKNFVLENWAPSWWHEHYGLTAEQFSKLAEDGMINPIGVWHFEPIHCDRMPDIEIYFDEKPKRAVEPFDWDDQA